MAKALNYFETKKVREVQLIKYIIKHYRIFPYTSDSHFGEYIHWGLEQIDEKGVREFYSKYKVKCKSEPKRLQQLLEGSLPSKQWLKPSGERAIPIIEGIITNSGQYELSVNIPNTDGIIEGLPHDTIIECPAIVDKNGCHGVKLKDAPKGIVGLWCNQASVRILVVEAALTHSKEVALQALLLDYVGR